MFLQIGNCVTGHRMKAFVSFLVLTPAAVLVGISPAVIPIIKRIPAAYAVSQTDEWINRVWWDWKGSWIVFMGPTGRWPMGIMLGFRLLDRSEGPKNHPGDLVAKPTMGLALTVFLACLFAIVASVRILPLFLPVPSRFHFV